MFRSHRKLMSLVTSIIMLTSIFSTTIIQGKGIVIEYDQPDTAVVIDVIDGEAIEVMHINSDRSQTTTERLKLIGVDSMANDDTYEYVKDQLLGKPVFILYDENPLPVTDNYRNAYVYVNTDESINETLLINGYAKLDTSYKKATYYSDLLKDEFYALRQEKGIYKLSTTPSNVININLASTSILEEHLGVSYQVARAIVNYRQENPINDSMELGFIHEDMNKEFIIDKRSSIHYITNINDATLYELTSLFSRSNALSIANDVNRDRIFNPFNSIEELKPYLTFDSDYETIEPFITTRSNALYTDKDLLVANVNTASAAQLVKATGMNIYYANKIVDQRENTAYVYRSLELLAKPNFPLANMDIYDYVDNLTFATEINTASDYELKTLFGSLKLSDESINVIIQKIQYNKPFNNYKTLANVIGSTYYESLEPVIYIEGVFKSEFTPVNVNSNSDKRLISYLDLNAAQEEILKSRKTDYTNPNQLSFVDKGDIDKLTLYTNINKASYAELLRLNENMTSSVANAIIEYRTYYPFYSLDELESLLSDLNRLYLFDQIKDEVVFY